MPGYGAAFGRGLIIGAGAALLYAAARESVAPERPALADGRDARLIDWEWATRVAVRTAGRTPAIHPSAQARLQAEYESLVREIEQPIAAYTGNQLSLGGIRIEVLDRAGWIRANMVNFRELLRPVEEFYRESTDRFTPPAPMQQGARLLLSSQIGLLVGYLARRVMGQYDLGLLGEEALTGGGRLYFVEPNLRQVEATLQLPREDLRRWIALHEATHAHEFELHPWLRSFLNSSLQRYLRLLTDDLRGRGDGNVLAGIAQRFVGNLRRGHNLVAALMTPEQRELMSRLQAMMALAEGYSNHVMNSVGRSLLPNFLLIHERVERRQRQRSQLEELFLKITGLSLKMEQYRLGERFVDQVVQQRGIAFVNRAWETPETLPTEAEIREPGRWVRRMEATVSA